MAYDSNSGVALLANVLSDRMKEENQSPQDIDFAVINEDYSLRTNRFPVDIPATDYTVCRHLCERIVRIPAEITATASGGSHGGHEYGDGSHTHSVDMTHEHLYKTRYLKPGDRVLVVWIQNEVCVIDLIVPATDIQKGGEVL